MVRLEMNISIHEKHPSPSECSFCLYLYFKFEIHFVKTSVVSDNAKKHKKVFFH